MFARIAVLTTTALLLVGCSSPEEQPAPSPAPTQQGGTRTGPEIGGQNAALGAVRVPVPPTRVQFGSLGIDVTVQPVGVEPDGFMEIPPRVEIAGWYKYGSDPGSDAGTTVIAAHVDSPVYGIGPFAELKNASVGANIAVTSADGTTHEFVVESVERVGKTQLPLDEIFDRDGPPRLALITCGGQFDYGTGHYVDNIVVIAVPTTP